MKTDLFRRVADMIIANPAHVNMVGWYGESACGTTACIGGWARYLVYCDKRNTPPSVDHLKETVKNDFLIGVIQTTYGDLIGIDGDSWNGLFLSGSWPIAYRERLARLKLNDVITNPVAYALVVYNYIHYFIECDGKIDRDLEYTDYYSKHQRDHGILAIAPY